MVTLDMFAFSSLGYLI